MQRPVSAIVGVIAVLVSSAVVAACGSEERELERASQALEAERLHEEAVMEEEEEGKKRLLREVREGATP